MNWTALVPAKRAFLQWFEVLQPTYNKRNIECTVFNSCGKSDATTTTTNCSTSMTLNCGICIPSGDSIHENIKQICLIPLTILILGINICVLLVILTNKRFHNTTYILVASLGIADLCVGFVSIGTLITRASERTLELCLIRIGFTIAACVGSLLVLMLIAIDRYIAVFKGLRYVQIVTKTKVLSGLCLASIVCLVAGFLPLMGWRTQSYYKYCSFLYVVPNEYVIFLFSTCVLLPILVMLIIYCRLYRNAQFHIKKIESVENITQPRSSTGQLRISPRTAKSLKTLLVVFGCVIFTWMPFLATSIVQIICGDSVCYLKDIVGTHLLLLGFSNSFLNPVIYAIGTRDFRDRFIQTCFRRFNCLKPQRTNVYPVLSGTRL